MVCDLGLVTRSRFTTTHLGFGELIIVYPFPNNEIYLLQQTYNYRAIIHDLKTDTPRTLFPTVSTLLSLATMSEDTHSCMRPPFLLTHKDTKRDVGSSRVQIYYFLESPMCPLAGLISGFPVQCQWTLGYSTLR